MRIQHQRFGALMVPPIHERVATVPTAKKALLPTPVPVRPVGW